jgi:hypothetical protein
MTVARLKDLCIDTDASEHLGRCSRSDPEGNELCAFVSGS